MKSAQETTPLLKASNMSVPTGSPAPEAISTARGSGATNAEGGGFQAESPFVYTHKREVSTGDETTVSIDSVPMIPPGSPTLSPDQVPYPKNPQSPGENTPQPTSTQFKENPRLRPSHPAKSHHPTPTTAKGSSYTSKRGTYSDERIPKQAFCVFNTEEGATLWLNRRDRAGLIMAMITLSLLSFSDFVVIYIVIVGEWPEIHAVIFTFLVVMAICSHLKVMFSDPGAVPRNAQPVIRGNAGQPETICGRCDAYKPARAHHCRICGRCIVRMDHHCPWMNNCVGWANQKHFCLFLLYTSSLSLYMLVLIAYSLIAGIKFGPVSYGLIYGMIILSFAAFLFTLSMILSQSHGILTGEGTVDRLQRRRKDKARIAHSHRSEDFKPVPLKDVFGKYTFLWLVPVGPHFEDPTRVRGFKFPDDDMESQDDASYGSMKDEYHGERKDSDARDFLDTKRFSDEESLDDSSKDSSIHGSIHGDNNGAWLLHTGEHSRTRSEDSTNDQAGEPVPSFYEDGTTFDDKSPSSHSSHHSVAKELV